MQSQEQLNVALMGVDPSGRRILSRALEQLSPGQLVWVDQTRAELAIVDLDSESGRRQWSAKAPEGLPVIALTAHNVKLANAVCLVKPIEGSELRRAIAALAPRIQARRRSLRIEQRTTQYRSAKREVTSLLQQQPYAVTRHAAERSAQRVAKHPVKAVNKHSPVRSAQETMLGESLPAAQRYDPRQYVQSLLQGAVDESAARNLPIIVRGFGGDVVVFDQGRRVYKRLPEAQLRQLCAQPIDTGLVAFLYARDATIDTEKLRVQSEPTEALLWRLALRCSAGRLPQGTSLERPLSLARWPNLTRLTPTPHAVQLAALWYNEPISLRATSALLEIPIADIFSFYSGCLQLGLIRTHRRTAPQARTAGGKAGAKPYLQRLLGYLQRLKGVT